MIAELREGLWRWTAEHPGWEPGADWPEQVGCFAHSGADGLVLIDPLLGDGDWDAVDRLAEDAGGVAAVAVTVGFHERSAPDAARRYDAELFAPRPRRERDALAQARPIADGDVLPGGIRALVVEQAEEALLYLQDARTLVAGDTLLARDGRLSLCPPSWLDRPEDHDEVRRGVERALELPLDAVAVSHGEPPLFARAELEAALSGP